MQLAEESSAPTFLMSARGLPKRLFQGERAGYLFLLPSALFLLVVIGYPLFDTVRMAFQEVTLGTL